MKRYLSLLLVIPLGLYACSSKDSGTPADNGGAPPGEQPGAGTPGTPGAPGGPVATPEELAKNPIDGATVKLTLDTGAATDGAIWSAKENVIFFTTPLGEGGLYRMTPEGVASKVRGGDPTTGQIPIGNALDKAGNLVTVEAKRIVRQGTSASAVGDAGAPTPVATGYDDSEAGVAPFDTLKGVVVTANGTIFATDPGYFAAPIANRIYRITPAGKVTVIEAFENVPRPNGLAITPDGKTLYVGFTQPEQGTKPFIQKYVLNADGTLGAKTKFVEFDMEALPDGIEVDQAGNVFVATKAGVSVFKPDGAKIGVVAVPEQPTGMAFGGKDLKTLYITTLGTKIFQITVNVPGIVQ